MLPLSVDLAAAQEWSSPLLDTVPVLVGKPSSHPARGSSPASEPIATQYAELPSEVTEALGPDLREYESFVVARVAGEKLAPVLALLREKQLFHSLDFPLEIQLPFIGFRPGSGRSSALLEGGERPGPGLFVVQSAFPIREDLLGTLSACGVEVLAPLQHWALLVRARSLAHLSRCTATRELAWIGSYRLGDRIAAEDLAGPERSFTLQFAPGTACVDALAALPAGVEALDERGRPLDGSCRGAAGNFLRVRASGKSLAKLVASAPDLLAVVPAGEAALSDERQGQIVAGNHNGVSVTGPGYKSWLQSRGLLSTLNAQTVATHDGGYDDGTFTGGGDGLGDHHPDLEMPDRLVATATFPGTATHEGDKFGHGTMVAGIIVGDVLNPTTPGAKDPAQYLYGLGIAPTARIAAARFGITTGLPSVGVQAEAHRWSAARAPIINHSWNKFTVNGAGVSVALPLYDDIAQALDLWTLDADDLTAGAQRVLEVVAASNFAAASGTPQFDTVSSPGTAKNVLTVGATESYRPIAAGPVATTRCPADATQIGRVADLSGRGREFRPYPYSATVTNTRVKPDVVAPGVRVFSTVPYQYSPYSIATAVGCTDFSPAGSFYTYGTGTSFAAPVVSGMAALKRQQLVNSGASSPSPSLVKAAIIATADTLGGIAGNDHRPSPRYGWGRANLNRLTDSRPTLIHNDNAATALTTGQERVFVGSVDSAASETRIVLVWSDLPSAIVADSQEPLVNDLQLRVEANGLYVGNNFNEVVTGVDDGFSYRWVLGPYFNDSKNTVEAVFLPANSLPAGSAVTIRVVGSNVTSGPQKFSLYAYNIR